MTVVRLDHDRFRAGLRFLFLAPVAASGTWRQDALVFGEKAENFHRERYVRDAHRKVEAKLSATIPLKLCALERNSHVHG